MSRAFVKETDDAGEPLPGEVLVRLVATGVCHTDAYTLSGAVSLHPNFVTPEGFAQIEAKVAALEAELRAARSTDDKPTLARVNRDLRYWSQRRASARVVPPPAGPPDVVRFGTVVTVRFEDAAVRTFKLVGEDEADPARGLVSWVAPLGRALTGKAIGDEVAVMGKPAEIAALTR